MDYDWGFFIPPRFGADGQLERNAETGAFVELGSWATTSSAMESNWNRCWSGPIDQRTTGSKDSDEETQQSQPNRLSPVKTWFTSLIENIDTNALIAIGLVLAAVSGAVVWFKRKKK